MVSMQTNALRQVHLGWAITDFVARTTPRIGYLCITSWAYGRAIGGSGLVRAADDVGR